MSVLVIPSIEDYMNAGDLALLADLPGTISAVSDTSSQTIVSTTYAPLPTPLTTTLVLTRKSLIAIAFGTRFGNGVLGAPTAQVTVTPYAAVSGGINLLSPTGAGDMVAVAGRAPGVPNANCGLVFLSAPAGTINIEMYAQRTTANMVIRDMWMQAVAIRAQ